MATKKTKHVRYTAPDFGAVFARIAEIVREESEALALFEVWEFYVYLRKYIEANQAQPLEATEARDYRRRKSRELRGIGKEKRVIGAPGPLWERRIAYIKRKKREGYGDINLIRTGHYLANIGTRLDVDGNKVVGQVRINPDATTDDGFSLQKLAKLLEYGYVRAKSVYRPARRGFPHRRERITALTRIPARPHWRPALLWYRATRRDKIPKTLCARIMKRIKADMNWAT